jgi:predicted regulator of Ras-like GTPase activity (Roadblock/LC7/MglB family)
MGLLSRLRETLLGKDIETAVEFEKELEELVTDYGLSHVSIIGIGGRLKGLPLIYSSENEKMIKNLAAKIPELIKPIQTLHSAQELERTVIKYKETYLILIKLTENIAFIGISDKKTPIEDSVLWIESKKDVINRLFKK